MSLFPHEASFKRVSVTIVFGSFLNLFLFGSKHEESVLANFCLAPPFGQWGVYNISLLENLTGDAIV